MKHNEPDTTQAQEESPSSLSNIAPGEIIIGTLVEIDKQGRPLVEFSENSSDQSLIAITTLGLTQAHIGRQVALLFANGNPQNPVIMGIIHSPLQDMLENYEEPKAGDESKSEELVELETSLNVDDVLIDGKKIVFEAKEQIVLKCGESSITLTRSGKIMIRGKYLLNRSTGVNRIMGGSVQVN